MVIQSRIFNFLYFPWIKLKCTSDLKKFEGLNLKCSFSWNSKLYWILKGNTSFRRVNYFGANRTNTCNKHRGRFVITLSTFKQNILTKDDCILELSMMVICSPQGRFWKVPNIVVLLCTLSIIIYIINHIVITDFLAPTWSIVIHTSWWSESSQLKLGLLDNVA